MQGFKKQPFTCWHPWVPGTPIGTNPCDYPVVVQSGHYPNGSAWNKIECGGCKIVTGCIWHPFTCRV